MPSALTDTELLEVERRVEDAFAQFQTAIRLKPEFAEAYYNLGAALFMTGNFAPALANFKLVQERIRNGAEGAHSK